MALNDDRVPFVQRVTTKTGVKLYFRRGDVRRRVKSPDGSAELRAEVEAILNELDKVEKAKTPLPGTVGGMIKAYQKSADFLSLGRKTQANYEAMLDEIQEDAGDVLLSDVSPAWVEAMKNAWASRGHRAANLRLQMLVNVLRPAIVAERVRADLFVNLRKVRRPHDVAEPNPIWTDAEIEAVLALAIERKMPGLGRAIALARWAGFRRGTICKVPLHARIVGFDRDGRPHRRLYWLTEKRRVLSDKPEDPRLTTFVEETPNRALTIAYNRRGDPWQERALNQAVDRLIERLAAEGKVRPNLTLHGLRHTRGVELALAGASDSEIMSQLEHKTVRAAQIYRRQAERRHLADSAQVKIDEELRRRQSVTTCRD